MGGTGDASTARFPHPSQGHVLLTTSPRFQPTTGTCWGPLAPAPHPGLLPEKARRPACYRHLPGPTGPSAPPSLLPGRGRPKTLPAYCWNPPGPTGPSTPPAGYRRGVEKPHPGLLPVGVSGDGANGRCKHRALTLSQNLSSHTVQVVVGMGHVRFELDGSYSWNLLGPTAPSTPPRPAAEGRRCTRLQAAPGTRPTLHMGPTGGLLPPAPPPGLLLQAR